MATKTSLAVCALFLVFGVGADPADPSVKDEESFLGPEFKTQPGADVVAAPTPGRFSNPANAVRYWNRIAVDASGLDHTPVKSGEPRMFGEQLGPGRAARAMAIVHIAMFDAVERDPRRL